jgi:hypothetical protein
LSRGSPISKESGYLIYKSGNRAGLTDITMCAATKGLLLYFFDFVEGEDHDFDFGGAFYDLWNSSQAVHHRHRRSEPLLFFLFRFVLFSSGHLFGQIEQQ